MTTHFPTDGTIGTNIDVTTTTAEFELGQTVQTNDGGEFIYVQASGAIDQYDFVVIDEDYQATAAILATGAKGDLGGVALIAFADNEYGFVCRKGANSSAIKVNAIASCAANTAIYVTATAGHIDDATASGSELVEGLFLTAAADTVAGATECVVNYPQLGTAT